MISKEAYVELLATLNESLKATAQFAEESKQELSKLSDWSEEVLGYCDQADDALTFGKRATTANSRTMIYCACMIAKSIHSAANGISGAISTLAVLYATNHAEIDTDNSKREG